MKNILLLLLSIHFTFLTAQDSSEIWLLRFKNGKTGKKITRITDNGLYSNQPSFYDDDHFNFTEITDGNADIMIFHMEQEEVTNFTATPGSSEYSGHINPEKNALTVVRVEEDGRQRLWEFPLDGGAPYLLLADVEPVGYFTWYGSGQLAMFVLGEPNKLVIADPGTTKSRELDSDIGRSLHAFPTDNSKFTYIRNGNPAVLMLAEDSGTREYARLPSGTSDVTWTPDGKLLTGKGSKLLLYNDPSGNWTEVRDFATEGVKDISRLDISPDGRYLLIVVHF